MRGCQVELLRTSAERLDLSRHAREFADELEAAMTAPSATLNRYLICLSPECEVFPVRATDLCDEDGVLIDRTWEPIGLGPDAGPEGCLTTLVAEGDLPGDAQLGQWHTMSDAADIVGYWTVEAG